MRVMKSFRMDQGLVDRVNEARGDVSFTRWVERALEAALGDQAVGSPRRVSEAEVVERRRRSEDFLAEPVRRFPAEERSIPRQSPFNVGPRAPVAPRPKGS